MKKHAISLFALTTIFLLGACSGDYPDEWGFVASLQHLETSITSANNSSYSLQLKDIVHVTNEGVGITKGGFLIHSSSNAEESTIPATLNRRGEEIVMEATIPSCSYNEYYNITPFVGTDDFVYTGEGVQFRRSIDEMKPNVFNMTTDVEMSANAHTITPIVETTEMIDELEFTFAGKTLKAQKSGNRFSADFDLNDLDASQEYAWEGQEYRGISYVAANLFGSANGTIDYAVRVIPYSQGNFNKREAGDGTKQNYITIGGVNWAKGNLICKNGVWSIDNDPFGHLTNQQDNGFVQYFSFGSTSADINSFLTYSTIDNIPSVISGDKRYDVVAANLDGWRLPTAEEAFKLMYSTSHQSCKNGIVLYYPQTADKYFYSNSQVTLKDMPTDGLYLPYGGMYGKVRNNVISQLYAQMGAYMTGEKTEPDDTYLKGGYCIYFYNPSPNNYAWLVDVNPRFDSNYRGNYNENFSLEWKYYVRPVLSN
mgnify:FL=1